MSARGALKAQDASLVPSIARHSAIEDALEQLRAHSTAVSTDASERASRVVAAAGEYQRAVDGRIANAMLLAAGITTSPVPDVEDAALELLGAIEAIPECALALATLRAPREDAAVRCGGTAGQTPANSNASVGLQSREGESSIGLRDPDVEHAALKGAPARGPVGCLARPAFTKPAPVPSSELSGLTALMAHAVSWPLVIVSTSASQREVLDRLSAAFRLVEWVHVSREQGHRRVQSLVERVKAGRVSALVVCRAGMPHNVFDPLKGASLAAKSVAFVMAGSGTWGSLTGALRELNNDVKRVRS